MAPDTNTTTTRRMPFPGRTTFRKRWDGRRSTIRRIVVSSAKSASGWIIGRSCAGNEVSKDNEASRDEEFQEVFWADDRSGRTRRGTGIGVARVGGNRRGSAGRAGNQAELQGADQRAAFLRICRKECGREGRRREVRQRHRRRDRHARKGI